MAQRTPNSKPGSAKGKLASVTAQPVAPNSKLVPPLDRGGLSASARRRLPGDVQARVRQAWSRGRALILNAGKPAYSEAFTIEAEQYSLLRQAILEAIDRFADIRGEVRLAEVLAFVQVELGHHPSFPKGRMTNYVRYTKVDLEARGEVERVAKSSPQRIRRVRT